VRSLVADANSHSDCDEADTHDGKSNNNIRTREFDWLGIQACCAFVTDPSEKKRERGPASEWASEGIS